MPLCAYVLPFNPHLLSPHRPLANTCMDRLSISLALFQALMFGSDLQCSLFHFSFYFSCLLLPRVSPLSSPPLALCLSMRLDCYLFVSSMRFHFVVLLLFPFFFALSFFVPLPLGLVPCVFFDPYAQAAFVSFVGMSPGRVPGLKYRRRNLFFPHTIRLPARDIIKHWLSTFVTNRLTVGLLPTQV